MLIGVSIQYFLYVAKQKCDKNGSLPLMYNTCIINVTQSYMILSLFSPHLMSDAIKKGRGIARKKPGGTGVTYFPLCLWIHFQGKQLFIFPTFSMRVNSERKEFAPTGANSFL